MSVSPSRSDTNGVDVSQMGANFLEAVARGELTPRKKYAAHTSTPRQRPTPPPLDPSGRQSSQPHHFMQDSPKVIHPFLRKNSSRAPSATNTPRESPLGPLQPVRHSSVSLGIEFVLEEKLTKREQAAMGRKSPVPHAGRARQRRMSSRQVQTASDRSLPCGVNGYDIILECYAEYLCRCQMAMIY